MTRLLRVDDLHFDPSFCALHAYVADEAGSLCWAVDIRCTRMLLNDEECAPRAHCSKVFLTKPGGGDWSAAFPREVRLRDTKASAEDPLAQLYVFEHLGVRGNRFSFGSWVDGAIPLVWQGVCDLHLDERYDTDLAFELRCELAFGGIKTGRLSERAARKKVAGYLDVSAFDYRVDEHGVSSLIPVATPAPEELRPAAGSRTKAKGRPRG